MRAVATIASIFVASWAAGCFDCRPLERRDLALECAPGASFRGELHLDSAETFSSFLLDRCLIDSTNDEIAAVVATVDFSREVVFIARGARGSVSRCIVGRAVESADVCADGLKIIFEDDETGDNDCPGDWTIAFAVSRADMRAAIVDE